jgi:hypothetical protein
MESRAGRLAATARGITTGGPHSDGIFRGARRMWTGIDGSGLIDGRLTALLNRRVAALNGCEF